MSTNPLMTQPEKEKKSGGLDISMLMELLGNNNSEADKDLQDLSDMRGLLLPDI